jgi:hypothetical protein
MSGVALRWPRIQSAYYDLFKAYPESYKNMVRFGLMACRVRDRQVAAGVFRHLGTRAFAAREMTEFDADSLRQCTSIANSLQFEPWVNGPPVEFGTPTVTKGSPFEIPAQAEPQLAMMLGFLRQLVVPDRSGWPRIIIGPEEARRLNISGPGTRFFAMASDGRPRVVTASAGGFESIPGLYVEKPDGSSVSLRPERGGPGLRNSATYRWDGKVSKALHVTRTYSDADPRVFVAYPYDTQQQVVTGAIRNVVKDSITRPITFEVVVPPGNESITPGSPVLNEGGWLLGVVAEVSEITGVTVLICEGAELLLDGPPRR